MLNAQKIRNMTKAAAYEEGPEKKNIEITKYFRGDYLGLQMIKSAIAYTAAFCILTAVWAMSDLEKLTLQISHTEYLQWLLKWLIALFVIGLIIYEIIVYLYYSAQYLQAKKSLKGYRAYLRGIHKFYEMQESAEQFSGENEDTDEENIL